MHVEEGAVTEQALVPSKAMPAPDSVMRIPALGPAVMAWVGVNEIVAVVEVSLTLEARVIEGNGVEGHVDPGTTNVPSCWLRRLPTTSRESIRTV